MFDAKQLMESEKVQKTIFYLTIFASVLSVVLLLALLFHFGVENPGGVTIRVVLANVLLWGNCYAWMRIRKQYREMK